MPDAPSAASAAGASTDGTTRPVVPVNLRNRGLAALLAWLVPGLGHWYQGRRGKAILYATCILGLYFIGLTIADFKVVYWKWTTPWADPENFRASYLAQLFVGIPAIPGMIQATLRHYGMDPILWGFLDMPAPNAANAIHPRLGRLVEVGWVYTVVAGLLNVLAIFDAYEGPALTEEPEPAADAAASRPDLTAPAREARA